MQKYHISINDLPPDGKEFDLDDQAIWQTPMREFGMDCRISKPLSAHISVLPAEDGCLVRGELHGQVVLPCNRCAEDAVTDIQSDFEDFEELPGEDELDAALTPHAASLAPDPAAATESRIVYERNTPLLDLAAVCWEEFMLALPVNPLCKADCKGLCAQCGANLNNGDCGCIPDEGDPRLAVLRGLTLQKTRHS